ncbi:MAG: cardiolipin synthase [Deltaproteobacteria bacterium]|nr:cardiolipin synthase [Deltaproteobacteria bacterium]
MSSLALTLVLAHLGLSAVLVADLLLRRKEPTSTMAWLQAIVFFPFLGSALYLLIGAGSLHRRRYRRRRKRLGPLETGKAARDGAAARAAQLNGFAADAVMLATATSRRSPTHGNTLQIFDNVSRVYDDIEAEVWRARDHVHFEYYLLEPDATGRRFLDLLEAKAREGVEVRLLVDGVGSRNLTGEHLRPLVRAGGQVGWFLPLRVFQRLQSLHLRNHRKIVVIDGRLAFTGGVNIGDAYRGRRARRAHWRDTHLKVEGPAVHHLQEVFAEDWWFATETKLTDDRYFPPLATAGDALIHVVASGPDDPARAIHTTLFHAIATAHHRVWIATPYFVPDTPIMAALETTARRGVDVRLLIPDRSDHPLVDRAGESYLPALLEAGARVYRYEAGMLHSKLVAIDGRWGTLGSANMDIRSFRLNFEVNLIALSVEITGQIEAIFERDLRQSRPVLPAELSIRPVHRRLTVAACRLLAPVL